MQNSVLKRQQHGGRMTKYKGQVASYAPYLFWASVSVAAISVGSGVSPVLANPVLGSLTSPQSVGDVDYTVENTGSVITSVDGPAVSVTAPYTQTFSNAGDIGVAGTGFSSAGTGVYFDGRLEAAGTVTNTGTIGVMNNNLSNAFSAPGFTDASQAPSSLSAYGLYFNADVAGTVTNSDMIDLDLLVDYYGTAVGIYVDGDLESTGTITNSVGAEINVNVSIASDQETSYPISGIAVGGDAAGTITNSGLIKVDGFMGESSSIRSTGIQVGSLSGTISNEGTISASARATYSESAIGVGILIEGDVSGGIRNTGTINAYAFNNYSSARAYGVQVDGEFSGTFTNTDNGIISASAKESYSDASAIGADFIGIFSGTFINNSGSMIIAKATATVSDATAYGLYFSRAITSNFTNDGTIKATATGLYAEAFGIYFDSEGTQSVTNNGLISASADGRFGDSYAGTARALDFNGDVTGSVVNNGTLIAKAFGTKAEDNDAEAYGIYLSSRSEVSGSVINTGTIEATAELGTSDDAEAYGIYASDRILGGVENSGTISAKATVFTSGDALARGFYIDADLGGFSNSSSGTITATAYLSGSGDATADGVFIDGEFSGTFVNDGVIAAKATASTGSGLPVFGDAAAWGLDFGDVVKSDITNNGTVKASATGYYASAYGVSFNEDAMSFENTSNGVIIAKATSNSSESGAYAAGLYYEEEADVVGNIVNNGFIQGIANGGIVTDDYVVAFGFRWDSSTSGPTFGSLDGTVTNNGTILATATMLFGDYAYATGFDSSATLGGFTNTGKIEGNVSAEYSGTASAWGVGIRDLDGDFVNSNTGVIRAEANLRNPSMGSSTGPSSPDGSATAVGVFAFDFASNIQNSGSITAIADAGSQTGFFDLSAFGVQIVQNVDGDFFNEGTVTASAIQTGTVSFEQYFQAIGVYVDGFEPATLGGNFENANSGVISASVSGGIVEYTFDASSFGAIGLLVEFDATLVGDISNSGTITATATADLVLTTSFGIATAFAYGVWINGDLQGQFTNSGLINASATVQFTGIPNAVGVLIDDSTIAGFTNNGTIMAKADGPTAYSLGYAAGVQFTEAVATDVTNNGTVIAQAEGGARVAGFGYQFNGELDGSFTNDGNILSMATGTFFGTAYGLEFTTITGNFLNDGLIQAKIENSDAGGTAIGVRGDVVSGTATNSGTILATADVSGYAAAYGFDIEMSLDDDFSNTGRISVTASAGGIAAASAYAVLLEGANGSVSNAGTITASANGPSFVQANGLYVNGTVANNFVNTNLIMAEVSNTVSSGGQVRGMFARSVDGNAESQGGISVSADVNGYAEAYGFYVQNGVSGDFKSMDQIFASSTSATSGGQAYGMRATSVDEDVEVDGTVQATVDVNGYASAFGVNIQNAIGDNFINNGSIVALGQSSGAGGQAVAVEASSIDGSATNQGTLLASVNGTGWVSGIGMDINGAISGDFTNNGTIIAKSTSSGGGGLAIGVRSDGMDNNATNFGDILASANVVGWASVYGYYVDGSVTDDFQNSGSIFAKASSSSGGGLVYGMRAKSVDGVINNTGNIVASRTGNGGTAYGLYIDTFDTVIETAGSIVATHSDPAGAAYAIYLGDGGGTLNLDTDDNVVGSIRVSDHDVNLTTFEGGSATFTFEDTNSAVGTFTKIENGDAWFAQDEGGDNPIYSTYGATTFNIQSSGIALAIGLSDYLYDLSEFVNNGTGPQGITGALAYSGNAGLSMAPFVQIEASRMESDGEFGERNTVSSRSLQAGSLFGLNGGGNMGVMLSYINSYARADASAGYTQSKVNGDGYAIDLVYSPKLGANSSLSFGLSAGKVDGDQTRYEDSTMATQADSNGGTSWVGASASWSTSYSVFGNWTASPSVGVGVYQVEFDGYTETGSAVSLATVEGRDATLMDAEIAVDFHKPLENGAFMLGGSIFTNEWSGDNSTDVTMFGTTQPVDVAQQDRLGVRFNFGIDEIRIGSGLLSVRTGLTFGDDNSQGISGAIRYDINF